MAALKYRPSIDGLRALAVIAVLVFHLHRDWLPGGFVGVDVFFVISGYLITSIILKECEQEKFTLGKFYQRRIARIFPAFFTVSLATIAGAFVFYSPQDFASAGANLAAATISLANVKLMTQGNYFTLSPDAQPFLHTWSLSVEEQFYIVFPIFLFVVYRYFRTRRWIGGSISALLVISFTCCVYLTAVNPTWAFFLLPTRAWELLAGCALTIVAENSHWRLGAKANNWVSNAGLLLILLSLFLITESEAFPGFIALLPVLGTVLVIGLNKGAYSLSEKTLALAPFVFIGQISYSLYLWHWPVFSFVDYSLVQASELTRMGLKIGITSAAAIICYFSIERPARRFLNQPEKRIPGFIALGIVVISIAMTGLSIRNNNYLNADADSVKAGGIVVNAESNAGSIMLMGDSNGSMYGTTAKEIADQLGYKLNIISVAAGDPLPDTPLWQDSLAAIQSERPDFLIVAASWESKLAGKQEKLEEAINELSKYCDWIILITQPPVLPKEANRESIRKNGLKAFREDPTTQFARTAANQIVKNQQSQKVIVIDVEPLFTQSTGEIKFFNDRGEQLYQDAGHLSGVGSDLVRDLILEAIISRTKDQTIVSHYSQER